MIYIKSTPIFKELRKFISFFKLSIIQYIFFFYLNFIRSKKKIGKKNNEENTLFFSNSTTEYRSWHTYERLVSKPLNHFKKVFKDKNNKVSFIRIIFPEGLKKLRKMDLQIIKEIIVKNKINTQKINLVFNRKQISFFRDLNKLDIKINSKIKEISINSYGTKLGLQILRKEKTRKLSKAKTIYIVLDAISYKSFLKSKVYEEYFSNFKHFLLETFSPSSLTGSSLPSLVTAKPMLSHLMGDYKKWFYSPFLECLSEDMKTIAEELKSKTSYSSAFTSFSKTMPFYGYYRGFDYYYNRCSGNNYSPSAQDIYSNEYFENIEFFKSLYSYYTFIHDIGGHPPVIPQVDNYSNYHEKESYLKSVDNSLIKLRNLISNMEFDNDLDNINLIITGDHTDSYGFDKNKFNLFPERISVPLFYKPAINNNVFELNNLLNKKNKFPSTYLISKIFENIYDIALNHPGFIFDEVTWLSSVYAYPKREYIVTIGFDDLTKNFICSKIQTSSMERFPFLSEENIFIKFYLLKKDNLKFIQKSNPLNKRLYSSFLKYTSECRKNRILPRYQKDIEMNKKNYDF